MKSIIKATALLGGASAITILIGLVSSKITAVLLGPSGFGLMALYQSVISLTVLIAGLGLPTAVTRAMAHALASGEIEAAISFRRAGWVVTICAAMVAMMIVSGLAPQVANWVLGSQSDSSWAWFIIPSILLSMVSTLQIAVINARHRVADLARISILSSALTLIPAVTLTWIFRNRGVAPALSASVLISLAVSHYYYRKSREEDTPRKGGRTLQLLDSCRQLIAFGLPYVVSVAVGAGILAILPIMILRRLGAEEVGLYRASSALAVNYLSVILASLSQDYFPRVAKVADDTASLNRIINDQIYLILLLAGPVIIAMMGAVPILIPFLYSSKFSGASAILEWQLFGDLFKFVTWAMGFVIMARLGSRIFFLTELLGGSVLLASSWFGIEVWGLPGLGIAFLVTGIIACVANWFVLYVKRGVTWRRNNIVLFTSLALAMSVLRIFSLEDKLILNTSVAVLLAGSFGAYSAFALMHEFGGWKAVLSRQRVASRG